MPSSKRLRDLERQIELLRKQFLPRRFDPLGQYPNAARVQAHARAFLVLSHAEIESYLEAWAKDIARACEAVWISSKRVTLPMAFLIGTHADRITPPDSLQGPKAIDSTQKLADAIVKLFQKYYKIINENNGIKEKNVLTLFAPLGIPASALGSTLLPNLDTLGRTRGSHAHLSAKAVLPVIDPETEYNRIVALLRELIVLDTWLVGYKRQVR